MSAATDRFQAAAARCGAAVFAHLATHTAAAFTPHGVQVEFDVIFDAQSVVAGLVSDIGPQALCQSADVSGVVWADGITIGGTAYTVSAIQPDGTGVTTLQLREA